MITSGLLRLAEDLGRRMLPAFQKTQSAIPYAWINLKRCGASPTASSLFAQVTIIFQSLVVVASITSDYGLRTAAIGSDTGFTRHLLPVIMTMMALLPAMLPAHSRLGVQYSGSL